MLTVTSKNEIFEAIMHFQEVDKTKYIIKTFDQVPLGRKVGNSVCGLI